MGYAYSTSNIANGWKYDEDIMTYDGTTVYVINKNNLFEAGLISYATFLIPSEHYVYTLLPADNDSAPPEGSTIPLVSLSYSFPSLRVFDISIDFDTNTGILKQVDNIKVADFNFVGPCDSSVDCTATNVTCPSEYFDCVPQPGVPKELYLNAEDDRLMHRLAYQNFGDHESMVVSHSVSVGIDSKNNTIVSSRWYEIIRQNDKFALKQQGTFYPGDEVSRFMPSIAQDKLGNIAMGYIVSDSLNVYPGSRVIGRRRNDDAGKMSHAEGIIVDGMTASLQQEIDSTFGDYTSMNIDPEDGCTFYYTNMYYVDNGVEKWKTKISQFALSGCD